MLGPTGDVTGDDLQIETTPIKKWKKTVSVPIQNIPSQVLYNTNQEFIVPPNPPVPPVLSPVIPAIDDDVSKKSTTSSACLRQLKADREAAKILLEIERQLLEKEREAILRDINLRQAIANEEEKNEELNVTAADVNSP